jgi:hypothetical protein
VSVRRPAQFGAILLTLGFGAQPASAYCRSTTCPDCPRDVETGCLKGGKPLAWRSSCVSFSMNEAALAGYDMELAHDLLMRAFKTWQDVRCSPDGAHPSITVEETFGPTLCTRVEFNPNQGNSNGILFREEWEHRGSGEALGVTKVSFDDATGAILDADMEINASFHLLLPDDVQTKAIIVDQYDLLTILTHEAGHFLGLDHSRVAGSSMKLAFNSREVQRDLGEDDIKAICKLYPPDAKTTCDERPTGGFSAQCGMDPTSGGACSLAEPPRDRGTSSLPAQGLGVALIALLGRWWRRRIMAS